MFSSPCCNTWLISCKGYKSISLCISLDQTTEMKQKLRACGLFPFQRQPDVRLFPGLFCGHLHAVCVHLPRLVTRTDPPWRGAWLAGWQSTSQSATGKQRNYISTLNPLRAKFFRENINIYLHFMSFLHTNKTRVVEIPPQVRQGPAYSTQSISWLLMSWRRKELGHQQPWYWPS